MLLCAIACTVKTKPHKVARNFRLTPEINAELKRRSQATGIDQTRIVEDALRHHFAGHMQQLLAKTLEQMKGFPQNPKRPLTPLGECLVMPL